MNNQIFYRDLTSSRMGLVGSFFLHAFTITILLLTARQVPKPVVVTPVYLIHFTQLPQVEEITWQQSTSATTGPAVRKQEKSIPAATAPTFSAEEFRKKLLNKLGSYQPLTGLAEEKPAAQENFSPQAYRQALASKLATASPEKVPVRSQGQLPEIPRLATTQVPAVSIPRLNADSSHIPDWYLALLKKKLEENWRLLRPYSLKEETALVSFRLEKDGSISDPVLDKSSALPEFNRSVLAAVKHSAPFPAFPREVKEDFLDITVEFSARGIR